MQITLDNPIREQSQAVATRMWKQLAGNPSALIASLEQAAPEDAQQLRASMTMLLGRMFKVERETLLSLAAAVEMLHTATLVHDDLLDQGSIGSDHQPQPSSFATSAAVLTGDLAFAAAANLAAETGSITMMQMFSETLQFLVNGEITYMFKNGNRLDREAYYRWIHAKTASLFELAAGAVASLGAADADAIITAGEFGYNLGMAFQIVADVLDFTAAPDDRDKPIGHNLRQGILTLPTLFYQEAHPSDQRVRSIARRNGHSQADLEQVIVAIRQSDAIDKALGEARKFVQHGLDALFRMPGTPERETLEQLASQIVV